MKEKETESDELNEAAESLTDLQVSSEEDVQGGAVLPTIRPYDGGFIGGVRVAADDVE